MIRLDNTIEVTSGNKAVSRINDTPCDVWFGAEKAVYALSDNKVLILFREWVTHEMVGCERGTDESYVKKYFDTMSALNREGICKKPTGIQEVEVLDNIVFTGSRVDERKLSAARKTDIKVKRKLLIEFYTIKPGVYHCIIADRIKYTNTYKYMLDNSMSSQRIDRYFNAARKMNECVDGHTEEGYRKFIDVLKSVEQSGRYGHVSCGRSLKDVIYDADD